MLKQDKIVTGLHVLGGIFTKNIDNLKTMSEFKNNVSKIIKSNGLNELGSFYYKFQGGGFTGIISLIESHISVHTWPELGYLTLDVFICNYSDDNSKVCKKVFNEISQYFEPFKIIKKYIER